MAEVNYRGYLNTLTKKRSEAVDADSIKDLLNYIERNYGKDIKKYSKSMLITVDGISIGFQSRYATPLTKSSVVSFLPVAGGG